MLGTGAGDGPAGPVDDDVAGGGAMAAAATSRFMSRALNCAASSRRVMT